MKRFRRIFVCVFCAFALLRGVTAIAAPEKQGGRFLFLVETSSAMEANKTALRRSLDSVIASGLNGQMHYGDTIGLWTYNDKLDPTFPMIIWRGEHVQDITNAVDFWMAKQKFAKRADFSKVTPMLQNVIKSSQKLTIIWISTGNDQITGTPFDASIGELHKEFRDDFRKQHIPFVTVLAVRKGAVIDFTVNPGDARIRLPEVFQKEAEERQVAEAKAAQAKVTAQPEAKKPSLVIKVGPSPEIVEQKKAADITKVQTNISVASAPAPAHTNTNVAVSSQASATTNTVAVVTNKPAIAQVTNTPASAQTNVAIGSNTPSVTATSAVVAVVPKPVTVVTSVPAQPVTNANVNSNEAIAQPAIKPQPIQQPAETPAMAVSAQSSISTMWIAIAAGVLLLVGGVIVLWLKQANATKGPSFISQSMTRDRLNSDASKSSSDNPAGHE